MVALKQINPTYDKRYSLKGNKSFINNNFAEQQTHHFLSCSSHFGKINKNQRELCILMTSITRFNILATLTAGILLAISLSYFFIYLPHHNYEKQACELKADYIATYKKTIQSETKRVLDDLTHRYHDFQLDADFHLTLHATTLQHIVMDAIKSHDNTIAQQTIAIEHGIDSTGFDEQEIIFIFDDNNNLVYDSESRRNERYNLPARVSAEQIVQQLSLRAAPPADKPISIIIPSQENDPLLKPTLRILDRSATAQKWRIIVAFSTQEIERKLQSRFLSRLAKIRFGTDHSGYFFVLNNQAEPLMIGAMTPSINENLTPLPMTSSMRPIANRFIELSLKGGGFHQFQLSNPAHNNAIEDKFAFVAPVSYWGWTIGTGFYTSQLDNTIHDGQTQLLEKTQQRIQIGYIVIAINLLAGLAIATYTNHHVRKLEVKRNAHLRNLEQYKTVIDRICLVSKSDIHGKITYANRSFCDASGYTQEELIGQPHNIIRHPSVPKTFFSNMWELIQAGKTWRGINKNRTKNGNPFYVDTVISPLTNEDGEIEEYIAARYDITELLEKRDKIKSIFATDSLTTLSTRHQLIEDLSINSDQKCLALFDIDDFHGINNQLGIEGADGVLRHVSEQMTDFFRDKNYRLYRLHSDIFAVLGCCSDGKLVKGCHQFIKHISNVPVITAQEEQFNLTLVAGIACGEEDIINCADNALLTAKKNNKPLEIYTPKLDGSHSKGRTYWINQVRKAIREQRLVPYFQPIVNLQTGEIDKYEALMRLIDENGKAVPPGSFLPILEQTRYYPEMTRSIVEQSCHFFCNRTEHFSINLSLDDLLRSRTVECILATAQKYGVTDRIVLEIVETENVQNYDLALEVLQLLGEQGMAIAIDDFGSGYANFSYLSEFPAKFVKIDGSLITKINQDTKTKSLVKTLIDYAHQGEMLVIAEFVSDNEIRKTIMELGCDFGQGYYFGAPIPASDIPPPQAETS